MAILIIIVLLVVLLAWRKGGSVKVVLNQEEAKAVRNRWWAAAIAELKAWALCFVFGYALAADTLAREHWHWSIYVLIVWCSLLLFSRLAIWVTIAGIAVLFGVGGLTQGLGYRLPELPLLAPLFIAVIFAIIIRAVFFLSGTVPVKQPKPEPEAAKRTPHPHTPEYDWDTDTWLYENGNREPAHIRFPLYGKSSKDRDLD